MAQAKTSLRQLLNTSWTLHRVSILHHGDEFPHVLDNPTALKTYASRLRDQLTGDILAGLQVGISGGGAVDEDTLSKTGALKTCTWEMISYLDDSESASNSSRGILIVLEYENIAYKAALLAPSPSSSVITTEGSTSLPLLLTRIPSSLQRTLISFLSSNFDTFCSPLRLPSHSICVGLNVYMNAFLSSDDVQNEPWDVLQDVVKDMQLTLSFPPSVAPALRSLNVNIPRTSFGDFLRDSPPSSSSTHDGSNSVFLSSLSAYLDKHLAMKLDLTTASRKQPAPVRLAKIACGGFVLGSEGRMKLVARPERATGDDGDDDVTESERDRLELRASEALLRDVLWRASVTK